MSHGLYFFVGVIVQVILCFITSVLDSCLHIESEISYKNGSNLQRYKITGIGSVGE